MTSDVALCETGTSISMRLQYLRLLTLISNSAVTVYARHLIEIDCPRLPFPVYLPYVRKLATGPNGTVTVPVLRTRLSVYPSKTDTVAALMLGRPRPTP
jgi:hypothetical protein